MAFTNMSNPELIPHLFRTEYRKIVAVLCKRFGFNQVEIAEDIASETFLAATQSWSMKGLPQNPVAWLYHVARNKARNHLRRTEVFDKKIAPVLKVYTGISCEEEIDLSPRNINDSQLQMMFAICHPSISAEAQIGLSLRILCGFGIEEIADAFLSNRETISKRLMRAKEKVREKKIEIEIPGPYQIENRLETVLTTIYLLFNEGYYSLGPHKTLKKDLCLEAMRLCTMLVENDLTNKPPVNALLAMMCFYASRFDARFDEKGEPVLYADQDDDLWNPELISRGGYFLKCAASGEQVTRYHLEAAIAYWSTQKMDTREKWEQVLLLYDQLLEVAYSPIAALHRCYAVSKINGNKAAIEEAENLNLASNPLYYLMLGELYMTEDTEKASQNLHTALKLVKTGGEKQTILKKIQKVL
jgi:RNA polymerase sigma factor (sigma-70 family)